MPRYLLSMCVPAGAVPPSAAELEQIMVEIMAIRDELQSRGSWVFAGGLHSAATATTVHPQDGDLVLTDGPFVESKEQIGGITIIDVPDLDEALEWASRQARATGTPVEVRPFLPDPSADLG